VSRALWQLTATEMSARLAQGEVSARELTEAHLARIEEVDGKVHAFTAVLREGARRDADRADAERRDGRVRGPLHGVPVTVKECLDLEGLATTLGLRMWQTNIAARDAAMVTALREAGAVILGRTNLSQTMLFAESRNPLFGQTANPFSLVHTPGGSSGGEAAAIAAGMSPLGLGTDIGGSVRNPCHFTGLAGLKPTLDRLPSRGQRTALAGQEVVRSQCGPLARTVDDLDLFFRALDPVRLSALDPKVPPLAWVEPDTVDVAKLTVGFYTDDGVLPASKALARALGRARETLEARGCKAVSFRLANVSSIVGDYLGALSSDGGRTMMDLLTEEVPDPVLVPLQRVAKLPPRVRRLAATLVDAVGQDRVGRVLHNVGEKSVKDLWTLIDRMRQARVALLDQMEREGVDVLLSPPAATPAWPHGMAKNFVLALSYTILWNVFQFPAGVVPVTRVRPDEASREVTGDLVERHAARVDAQSAGLPVGVQVIARPWHDHVVLAVMREIEAGVRGDAGFPSTPVVRVG
jgi:fatty acid amide hydrolase